MATLKGEIMTRKGQLFAFIGVCVAFAAIGGCIGAVLTMVFGSFLPLGAQRKRDNNFGHIVCSRLTVSDPDGVMPFLSLGYDEHGGYVAINGKDGAGGSVSLGVDEHGGSIIVSSTLGERVLVDIDEHGGGVSIYARDKFESHYQGEGEQVASMRDRGHGGFIWVTDVDRKGFAVMAGNERGGTVAVVGKERKGVAVMKIEGHGGEVTAYGSEKGFPVTVDDEGRYGVVYNAKANSKAASIGIDEYGGNFAAYGKGSDESRVLIGVNEYGNGAVTTWDRGGYRQ